MKFIIGYFASLFLFASLISSAKIKNTQLFDAFEKTLIAQNTPSKNSAFNNFQEIKKVIIIFIFFNQNYYKI